MASSDTNPRAMQSAIKDALGKHWRLFLFQGVVMSALGVLAIVAPVAATFAVDIFIGWLFLISGVVGLIATFSAHDVPAFLWTLVTAALSVAIGVMLIWRPVEGAMSITLVLTALFIAEGVFQIATSIGYRHMLVGTWGWMLVSGVADLILAAIIILAWPLSAIWALGLIVGINLLTTGWAIVMVALAGRAVARTTMDAGAPA